MNVDETLLDMVTQICDNSNAMHSEKKNLIFCIQ